MSKEHIALILDKSGSMSTCIEATVSNYNEQIEQIKLNKQDGQDITVSLVTFNANVYEHLFEEPVDRLELASTAGYQPEGSTNIWDAVGHIIDRWQKDTPVDDEDHSYLVILISDGGHNSNGTWNIHRLREEIVRLQETKRWTFTFLGHDPAYLQQVSAVTGIPLGNMGVWSNAGGNKSASQTGRMAIKGLVAGAGMGGYLQSRRVGGAAGQAVSRGFYSGVEDRIADFSGAGTDSVEKTSGGLSPPPPATLSSPSTPEPDYKLGTANVFGKGSRVS